MRWWTSKEKPDYWIAYEQHFKSTWSKSTPIGDLHFLVLDTETTGLNPKVDRILSIGGIPVSHGFVHANQTFHTFVRQSEYSAESAVVHGITQSTAQQGASEEEALKQLLSIAQDKIIVGHHIGFDMLMLNRMAKRVCNMQLKNISIDTSTLFKRAFPENYGYYLPHQNQHVALDEVADKFNITTHDRHSALGDCMITAIAFVKLLKKLEKKQVRNLKELLIRFG